MLSMEAKKERFCPVNIYIFVYYLRLSIVIVGKTPFSYGHNRKQQVVMTRCRIGHSRLTHSFLLNNEERPECIPCNSNFSLKHVLIDYVDVADVRQTFYNANSLSNLFTNVAGDTILQFLKEIDLYTKI